MAAKLTLLLSALLSFPVALGLTGCKIPGDSLQRFVSYTRDHWTHRMEDVIEGATFPNMPGGLVSCRGMLMTCSSVTADLLPLVGLDVNVFLEAGILCRLASVSVRLGVSLCIKVRLRLAAQGLAVDGCAVVDVTVVLPPLLVLSLQASLLVDPITVILSGLCCQRAPKVCDELNYLFDLPGGSFVSIGGRPMVGHSFPMAAADGVSLGFLGQLLHSGSSAFPPNCTVAFQKQRPLISSRDIDFHCRTTVNCGGTEYPFLMDPGFVLPSLLTSGDIIVYVGALQLNSIFTFWRNLLWFDTTLTLFSLTTSTVMAHIPEITVPGNHPIVIRIKCLDIYVALNPDKATLRGSFWIEIGYQDFTLLIRLTLGITFRLYLRVDCPRRLMLLSVDDHTSDWQLSGSCADRHCELLRSEMETLFGLHWLCRDLINKQLSTGLRWPLFRAYGCDTCSDTICIKDTFYWPCRIHYPML